jgi:acyl-CoA thioester hydrolase
MGALDEARMGRVKLKEQDEYEFTHRLTVQVGHINYGGHVGYDAILAMTWEARVNAFHVLGITELDLGDGKTGMLMRDLVVNFREEVFMFDDVVVGSHIGEITNHGFRMFYRLTKAGRLVALVETGFAAFDLKGHSLAPVPDTFRGALDRHRINLGKP